MNAPRSSLLDRILDQPDEKVVMGILPNAMPLLGDLCQPLGQREIIAVETGMQLPWKRTTPADDVTILEIIKRSGARYVILDSASPAPPLIDSIAYHQEEQLSCRIYDLRR